MIIHTKVPASRRKKKKSRGPIAKKLDVEKLIRESAKSTYNPPRKVLRDGAEEASKIKSHVTTTQFVPNRTGVMDAAFLAKESPEVREAIIAKSKRIAIAYNKGAYQYVSDESDAKTIGRKNPI